MIARNKFILNFSDTFSIENERIQVMHYFLIYIT